MRVGSLEILPVIDGELRVPISQVYAGKTDADWAPHLGLLDRWRSRD